MCMNTRVGVVFTMGGDEKCCVHAAAYLHLYRSTAVHTHYRKHRGFVALVFPGFER